MSGFDTKDLETLPWMGDDTDEGTVKSPVPDLEERYRLVSCVGRGGMGEVWRVRDQLLQRTLVRKVLRQDRSLDPVAVARFNDEARITAHLQHAGVVPVHDVGLLDDGRPFYTMREVRGPRLSDVLREQPPLRRCVELVVRVGDVMAHAHAQGIVHRDLKPSNVMVGSRDAVMVLDWGIARAGPPLDIDGFADRIVGTPAYMAPEMARGEFERVGPSSDVFALGAMLLEALSGYSPRGGSTADVLVQARREPLRSLPEGTDPALCSIQERATHLDPAERYPDARAFAAALSDWLAGTDRRERALRAVAVARERHEEHRRLADQVRLYRRRAATHLEGLGPNATDAEKAVGWELEDEAESLDAMARLASTRQEQELLAALRIDPDLPEAHRGLAALYRSRHERAERAADEATAASVEVQLRTHDRGEHRTYLQGRGWLTLHSEPGTHLRLHRYVLQGRRLQPSETRDLGPGPLERLELPRGSYLVELCHPERRTVRYPVQIERAAHWDGVPPGADRPLSIPLPTQLTEHCIYVPAGWFRGGGDPEATDGLPAQRVWVDGFVIGEHPVTHGEYLVFLNDLVEQGRLEEAERYAPHGGRHIEQHLRMGYGRDRAGRFRLVDPDTQIRWTSRMPVVSVSWTAAMAYCDWLAGRTGLPWRLPHSLEWEKAARGVDGRALPWGDFLEPSWACFGHHPDPVSVEDYPTDCSPYGVRGLVGNVRDFCFDRYTKEGPTEVRLDDRDAEGLRLVRGGNATSGASLVRPAARMAAPRERRFTMCGFRVARSL